MAMYKVFRPFDNFLELVDISLLLLTLNDA